MNEIKQIGDYEIIEWLGERSLRPVYDFITGNTEGALEMEGHNFIFNGDEATIFYKDKEFTITENDYIVRSKITRHESVPKEVFKLCKNKMKEFMSSMMANE